MLYNSLVEEDYLEVSCSRKKKCYYRLGINDDFIVVKYILKGFNVSIGKVDQVETLLVQETND